MIQIILLALRCWFLRVTVYWRQRSRIRSVYLFENIGIIKFIIYCIWIWVILFVIIFPHWSMDMAIVSCVSRVRRKRFGVVLVIKLLFVPCSSSTLWFITFIPRAALICRASRGSSSTSQYDGLGPPEFSRIMSLKSLKIWLIFIIFFWVILISVKSILCSIGLRHNKALVGHDFQYTSMILLAPVVYWVFFKALLAYTSVYDTLNLELRP